MVRVFHSQAGPRDEEITANATIEIYEAYWATSGAFGSGVTRVELLMRGTLEGPGTGGTDAVADQKVWAVLPASSESYEYDGAGRLEADSLWNYTWNGMGRLVSMQRKAGTSADPELTSETIAFVYDADGHRTLKTRTRSYEDAPDKVETSKVYWSDWLPVCEEISVDGGTPSRRWFVWGQDVSGSWDGAGGIGGLLAIQEEGGRTLLPVHDGLGNITALIHAGNGDTVATYDYAPFGEIVAESGEVNACPFRYQSKFYDSETGLSYFGFRYYSAKLGRWISRDPLGEDGGFNLYAYCANDPVNGWDYLGMVEKQDVENATKAARDSLSVLGNLAVLIGSGLTEGESIELGVGYGRAELLEAGAAAQEAYDKAVTDAMKARADYLVDMGMFEGLWDSSWEAANAPMALPMTQVPSPRQLAWQRAYIENGGDAAAMMAESAADAANTAQNIENGATMISMAAGVGSIGTQGVKIFVTQGGKATLKYVGKVGASVAVGGLIDAGIGLGADQLGIPPEQVEAFRKGMALLGAMRTLKALNIAKGGFIDPGKVRFTQDSIGSAFKNGQSIDDVARALRGPGGADLAKEFPAIRLVEKDGLLFTLDNRRLATFSAGGRQVPYRMATPAEIAKEWEAKFTTTAEQGWGRFISVRPPKR